MEDSVLTIRRHRLAVAGEELIVYKFRSGSTGLLSCLDYEHWTRQCRQPFPSCLRTVFYRGAEPGPLVWVPPGSWLRLIGIPQILRLRAGECPDAVFIYIETDSGCVCEALSFAYGNALLRFVPGGQRLRIISLSSRGETEPQMGELEPMPCAG